MFLGFHNYVFAMVENDVYIAVAKMHRACVYCQARFASQFRKVLASQIQDNCSRCNQLRVSG